MPRVKASPTQRDEARDILLAYRRHGMKGREIALTIGIHQVYVGNAVSGLHCPGWAIMRVLEFASQAVACPSVDIFKASA